VLEAEDGSGAWRKITDVEAGSIPTTVSFAPVTARRFRLVLHPAPPTKLALGMDVPGVASLPFPTSAPKAAKLSLFQLSAEPRINRAEAKGGFEVARDYYALDADAGPDVVGVDPGSVVDLTDKVGPDGRLRWTPPAGRWKVLRMGWSLLGTTNHPATHE